MGHTVLENSVVQRTECHAEPEYSDCPEDNPLYSDPHLHVTKHKSILNAIQHLHYLRESTKKSTCSLPT